MYHHEAIQMLSNLYKSMPVATDGYFFSTRRGRCSISVSPETIEFALRFLDCLCLSIEQSTGTVEIQVDGDDVPIMIADIQGQKIVIGIRETQNIKNLESQKTMFGAGKKGYCIVPKIDTSATGRLKFSYHCRGDYRYREIYQTESLDLQIDKIINTLAACAVGQRVPAS